MSAVTSVDDVEGLIARAAKGRSTFATDMNEHSSRSHLILSLYVRTDNKLSGERTASKLHLIDLAGSERVSRSNAEGQRLKEAQNINTSLSALGDVIQSLRAQTQHVPYRNCKLTRLLSDSLGGKSKTLLVVNLSPARDSASESRCSCEFASRAKKVELGRAVRQVEGSGGGNPSSAAPSGNPAERSPQGGKARAASIGASARPVSRSVSRTRAMASSPDLNRFR
jgi:kinesin family member C2/C3